MKPIPQWIFDVLAWITVAILLALALWFASPGCIFWVMVLSLFRLPWDRIRQYFKENWN